MCQRLSTIRTTVAWHGMAYCNTASVVSKHCLFETKSMPHSADAVPKGVEVVDGKVIIYSGGAFIDDYAQDLEFRNDLSAVMVAEFHRTSMSAAAEAEQELARAEAEAQSAQATVVVTGGNIEHRQGSPCGVTLSQIRHRAPASLHAATMTCMSRANTSADDLPRSCCMQPASSSRPTSDNRSSRKPMALHRLLALPIAITHQWQDKDGTHAPSTQTKTPAYFSHVCAIRCPMFHPMHSFHAH